MKVWDPEKALGRARPAGLQGDRRLTLARALELWLADFATDDDGYARPRKTLESYRGAIERCLLPSLGKTPVSDIDLPDLTDAIRGFLMVDGRPASAAYKEKVSGATKSLFRWMREQRLIASDPGTACRMS